MSALLAARLDHVGDVLLAGPAIRALATGGAVTVLASPAGAPAARLLPGVDDVIVWDAPWISAEPPPVRRHEIDRLLELVAARGFAEAVIFTSFHQSPLPLALLLRMAGLPRIAAISEDYPGSLLDVRHHVDDRVHEVERALSLVAATGRRLPEDDDGGLRIRLDEVARSDPVETAPELREPYVVVHPGASVSARTWDPTAFADLVRRLGRRGRTVVVTGSAGERGLTAQVAAAHARAIDVGGKLDLPGLARLLDRAEVLVVGNTGPAHLAAAVGTPVVSLFPPTVPAERWRPWHVPHVLLGDQLIECAGCRARICPVVGQPCVGVVTVDHVLEALDALTGHEAVAV